MRVSPLRVQEEGPTEVLVAECVAPLSAVGEAMDLVAACAELRTDRLLLDTPVLPPAFFDLRTLFAGEFLQKLQTYHIRAAVVVSPDGEYGERFAQFLVEARRGRYCRLFTARAEAIAWLTQE